MGQERLIGNRAAAPASTVGEQLDMLYRLYHDAVRRYVAKRFGSGPPDPDDVVQVAFENYASSVDRVRIDNPRAFLIRSARNYVIDQHRRQAVRADYARDVLTTADASDDLDAERVLDSRQRWAAIETAIAGLDERSRQFLLMSRIQGLSSAEIARRAGCSPTLVKGIIARALVACHRAVAEAD